MSFLIEQGIQKYPGKKSATAMKICSFLSIK